MPDENALTSSSNLKMTVTTWGLLDTLFEDIRIQNIRFVCRVSNSYFGQIFGLRKKYILENNFWFGSILFEIFDGVCLKKRFLLFFLESIEHHFGKR